MAEPGRRRDAETRVYDPRDLLVVDSVPGGKRALTTAVVSARQDVCFGWSGAFGSSAAQSAASDGGKAAIDAPHIGIGRAERSSVSGRHGLEEFLELTEADDVLRRAAPLTSSLASG